MVAASRYGDQYDGYLAIAPGFNLPKAALAQIWGAQQWSSVATEQGVPSDPDTGLATALTGTERTLIADKILSQCDELDGLADGMVLDTEGCQHAFNPARDIPACAGERDGTCLSYAQLGVLSRVFSGAQTSTEGDIYNSWFYDYGIRQQNWADWKFEYSTDNRRDAVAFGYIFTTPPNPPEDSSDTTSTYAYAMNLDIDAAYDSIFASTEVYTESSMSFMTPPDPTNLDTISSRGAKMLITHGVSDGIFSANDTVEWFNELDSAYNGNAEDFARLFLVPGMGHSRGGPSTDQYDALQTLVNWVEQGEAPSSITANVREDNDDVVSQDWPTNRSRPLCMYPTKAMFIEGSSDTESADSFECL